MRTIDELGYTSRTTGYNDSLKEVRSVLMVLALQADQAFQLQRETDSNYLDPRTDYLLGRRDAIVETIARMSEPTE